MLYAYLRRQWRYPFLVIYACAHLACQFHWIRVQDQVFILVGLFGRTLFRMIIEENPW